MVIQSNSERQSTLTVISKTPIHMPKRNLATDLPMDTTSSVARPSVMILLWMAQLPKSHTLTPKELTAIDLLTAMVIQSNLERPLRPTVWLSKILTHMLNWDLTPTLWLIWEVPITPRLFQSQDSLELLLPQPLLLVLKVLMVKKKLSKLKILKTSLTDRLIRPTLDFLMHLRLFKHQSKMDIGPKLSQLQDSSLLLLPQPLLLVLKVLMVKKKLSKLKILKTSLTDRLIRPTLDFLMHLRLFKHQSKMDIGPKLSQLQDSSLLLLPLLQMSTLKVLMVKRPLLMPKNQNNSLMIEPT